MTAIFMEICVRFFCKTDTPHSIYFIWLVVGIYCFMALPLFLKTLSFLLVIFVISFVNKFPAFFSM